LQSFEPGQRTHQPWDPSVQVISIRRAQRHVTQLSLRPWRFAIDVDVRTRHCCHSPDLRGRPDQVHHHSGAAQ
jgi:hypothetical protein